MTWQAKKIRKEAQRNKLDVDDLIEAISAVQYERRGLVFDGALYRSKVKDDIPELWEVAEEIADYFKTQKNTY